MAKAVTIWRDSADDRKGPPQASPFRSKSEEARYVAAQEMVAKRERELAGLQEILSRTTDRSTQKILAQRIKGTKNNLASWLRYIDQATPREPRAVVQPRPVRRGKVRAS